jgi:DNA-binding CsgD family transcriptional regulator
MNKNKKSLSSLELYNVVQRMEVHFKGKNLNRYLLRLMDIYTQIEKIREIEIIFYILQHKTGKEIANILKIKLKTVKSYKTNIYKKLHVKSQLELIRHYLDIEKSSPEFPSQSQTTNSISLK